MSIDPEQYRITKAALWARELYWSSIDQLDRASEAPSVKSLLAWEEVVRSIEGGARDV